MGCQWAHGPPSPHVSLRAGVEGEASPTGTQEPSGRVGGPPGLASVFCADLMEISMDIPISMHL